MTRRYALSDAHWERIKDLLPGQAGQPGATARDNRLFVEYLFTPPSSRTPAIPN